MPDLSHSLAMILVMALATAATRVLPFLVFGGKKEPPAPILYLGRVLPPAVMAMLVIYCLRNTSFAWPTFGLPELLAAACAIGLHIWRRNTLLSIAGATVLYMALVQLVF